MLSPFCWLTLSAPDPEQLKNHAGRILMALRYADISKEKAAVVMEIDRRQFDRQLNGEGHISYTRLIKLPIEFWQWFWWLTANDVGAPAIVRRAAKLQLALLGKKPQMARADAKSAQDKRESA